MPENRLDRIHAAACAAFLKKGYGGTKMEDIAASVGVGRSALYASFPTKEALFRGLVTNLVEHALPLERILQGIEAQTLPEVLGDLIARLTLAMSKGAGPVLHRLIIAEGAQFPELGRAYRKGVLQPLVTTVEGLLELGVRRGEFTAPDTRLAAQHIAGAMIMTVLWPRVFDPRASKAKVLEAANALAGMLLYGVLKR
ncbi:TetR/AcrR family transcriptional regulator [Novosphingobium cyanobacteriorum]|uniref:TetR/AcrR family transcriptional regulator n=1 Tax=Novosphingobium cyanobacteriorum TaxID=3024215 RepID=A0ABT6CRF8_9SPHN|nr:TetR/AcrR family transcriptional regulator [Novosphingobium cyanobacteriorum]MDF8335147.1 TetR/AcrR family transcriptional regulator [Novosphingobium cyanobacteriorum]